MFHTAMISYRIPFAVKRLWGLIALFSWLKYDDDDDDDDDYDRYHDCDYNYDYD